MVLNYVPSKQQSESTTPRADAGAGVVPYGDQSSRMSFAGDTFAGRPSVAPNPSSLTTFQQSASSREIMMKEDVKHEVFRELHNIVSTLRSPGVPPITINNISSTNTANMVKESGDTAKPVQRRGSIELALEFAQSFFASPFNRICFFGITGMSTMIVWNFLDHRWRMHEMQRRIDSNLLLKLTQYAFASGAGRV